jgi:hypothetical protein
VIFETVKVVNLRFFPLGCATAIMCSNIINISRSISFSFGRRKYKTTAIVYFLGEFSDYFE